ncbi:MULTISPECIES: hemolysin family protein [unclassified Paenibacillus]|uniref:Hemolysin family protein n=1 Tax=Paenibacillus provencensis TaxID=441151 RepID=A0ABW3PVA1_9BACL|nr:MULTISPECIES: hemolysin family protein [unclassified Paenibacillus]MCM3128949.1 hemolysin family protein [Paenibacillus sp. MER 78]SFS50497.1 Hemolysin, contains CBS domains [Paenibacillus sp. 453mf]
MGIGLNLFLFAILIVLTAFFVATEFAIIKLRPSRVDQLVLEGRRGALAVQKVTTNLDGYLSACQLGITITALGLGWLGEPTVAIMIEPLFARLGAPDELVHLFSFIIAFAIVTFLHVVVGELAPKTLAIQKAEAITFLVARPIMLFYKIMYPFIWLLNGSANKLVQMFGLKPVKEHEDAHSEEEIQIILSESYQSGKINNTEYGYVNRIFAFDEKLAKEIMIPRTDMVCLYTNNTLEENMSIIHREQYTRFPVAHQGKDQIVGMINTKQLFLNYRENETFDLKQFMHPVLSVSEATPVNELLKRMQKEQVHLAVIVDEFGGTAGLITIEDILEEIVGEIRDEFDSEERKEIEQIGEMHYIVDGKIQLDQIADLTGLHFDLETADTIGGWLFTILMNPKVGHTHYHEGMVFTVKEVGRNRVKKVEFKKAPEEIELELTPQAVG